MDLLFKLHLDDGAGNSRVFDFDQKKVVIGRDPAADVVIDDIQISRRHLVLTREKNGFFAEDKKSTNGSFLDGKPLKKKTPLNSGNVLTLGKDHTLTFEVIEPPPAQEEPEVEEPVEEVQEAAPIKEAEAEPESEQADKPAQEEQKPAETVTQAPPAVEEILPKKKQKKSKPVRKERPKWVVILLAALVFIVVFCVIPLVVIEVTNQWCDLFAGFFNSMSPGVCP